YFPGAVACAGIFQPPRTPPHFVALGLTSFFHRGRLGLHGSLNARRLHGGFYSCVIHRDRCSITVPFKPF
ncbi:hypothetical protein, partial [Acinetobacter baumannii]|uniref:hypothetical protein n=1 Tax=Acinetobacter baumannii TaxID=470 RepID=UPI001C07D4F8